MAAERAEPSGGGIDAGLSRKYGPLPAWGWIAAAAGVGLIYIYMKNRSASSSAASDSGSTGAADSTDTGNDTGASIATIQSEVQQLQGEESTTSQTAAAAEDTANRANKNAEKQAAINRSQTQAIRKDREEDSKGKTSGTNRAAGAGGSGGGSAKQVPNRKPPARKPPVRKPPAKKAGPVHR